MSFRILLFAVLMPILSHGSELRRRWRVEAIPLLPAEGLATVSAARELEDGSFLVLAHSGTTNSAIFSTRVSAAGTASGPVRSIPSSEFLPYRLLPGADGGFDSIGFVSTALASSPRRIERRSSDGSLRGTCTWDPATVGEIQSVAADRALLSDLLFVATSYLPSATKPVPHAEIAALRTDGSRAWTRWIEGVGAAIEWTPQSTADGGVVVWSNSGITRFTSDGNQRWSTGTAYPVQVVEMTGGDFWVRRPQHLTRVDGATGQIVSDVSADFETGQSGAFSPFPEALVVPEGTSDFLLSQSRQDGSRRLLRLDGQGRPRWESPLFVSPRESVGQIPSLLPLPGNQTAVLEGRGWEAFVSLFDGDGWRRGTLPLEDPWRCSFVDVRDGHFTVLVSGRRVFLESFEWIPDDPQAPRVTSFTTGGTRFAPRILDLKAEVVGAEPMESGWNMFGTFVGPDSQVPGTRFLQSVGPRAVHAAWFGTTNRFGSRVSPVVKTLLSARPTPVSTSVTLATGAGVRLHAGTVPAGTAVEWQVDGTTVEGAMQADLDLSTAQVRPGARVEALFHSSDEVVPGWSGVLQVTPNARFAWSVPASWNPLYSPITGALLPSFVAAGDGGVVQFGRDRSRRWSPEGRLLWETGEGALSAVRSAGNDATFVSGASGLRKVRDDGTVEWRSNIGEGASMGSKPSLIPASDGGCWIGLREDFRPVRGFQKIDGAGGMTGATVPGTNADPALLIATASSGPSGGIILGTVGMTNSALVWFDREGNETGRAAFPAEWRLYEGQEMAVMPDGDVVVGVLTNGFSNTFRAARVRPGNWRWLQTPSGIPGNPFNRFHPVSDGGVIGLVQSEFMASFEIVSWDSEGRFRWQRLPDSRPSTFGRVVYQDGRLYLLEGGTYFSLSALGLDGAELWKVSIGSAGAPPVQPQYWEFDFAAASGGRIYLHQFRRDSDPVGSEPTLMAFDDLRTLSPTVFRSYPRLELFPSSTGPRITAEVEAPTDSRLQWYRNGNPVPGATNRILDLSEAARRNGFASLLTHPADYWLGVSVPGGEVRSGWLWVGTDNFVTSLPLGARLDVLNWLGGAWRGGPVFHEGREVPMSDFRPVILDVTTQSAGIYALGTNRSPSVQVFVQTNASLQLNRAAAPAEAIWISDGDGTSVGIHRVPGPGAPGVQITRWSPDFEVVWTRHLESVDAALPRARSDGTGGVVLALVWERFPNPTTRLVRLDATGEVSWSRTLPIDLPPEGSSISPAGLQVHGGWIGVLEANSMVNGQTAFMRVHRVGLDGTEASPTSSTVGIESPVGKFEWDIRDDGRVGLAHDQGLFVFDGAWSRKEDGPLVGVAAAGGGRWIVSGPPGVWTSNSDGTRGRTNGMVEGTLRRLGNTRFLATSPLSTSIIDAYAEIVFQYPFQVNVVPLADGGYVVQNEVVGADGHWRTQFSGGIPGFTFLPVSPELVLKVSDGTPAATGDRSADLERLEIRGDLGGPRWLEQPQSGEHPAGAQAEIRARATGIAPVHLVWNTETNPVEPTEDGVTYRVELDSGSRWVRAQAWDASGATLSKWAQLRTEFDRLSFPSPTAGGSAFQLGFRSRRIPTGREGILRVESSTDLRIWREEGHILGPNAFFDQTGTLTVPSSEPFRMYRVVPVGH